LREEEIWYGLGLATKLRPNRNQIQQNQIQKAIFGRIRVSLRAEQVENSGLYGKELASSVLDF